MHKNILKKVWCVLLALSFFITPIFFNPIEALAYEADVSYYDYYVIFSNNAYVSGTCEVDGAINPNSNKKQNLYLIQIDIPFSSTVHKEDEVIIKYNWVELITDFSSMSCQLVLDYGNGTNYIVNGSYKNGVSTFSFKSPKDFDSCTLTAYFQDFTFKSTSNPNAVIAFTSIDIEVNSVEEGFWNTIFEWLKSIKDSITGIPDKIQSFFSDLKSSITSSFNNLKQWVSDLGSQIGGFFSSLGNSIKEWFTNLGDNISGFFEKLWNRIWWGNENGVSAYQPPVFSSGVLEVLNKLDDYYIQLDDTKLQIDNSKIVISDYVVSGTNIINEVFGVFPSILTAFVVFGIVFVFSRKVVGR